MIKCLIKESKQWLQGNSESREYRKFREIKKNEKLLEEIKLIKQYQMKYCNEEFLSHKKKKKLKASTAGCIHQKKYSVNWKAFLKRYSQGKQRKE